MSHEKTNKPAPGVASHSGRTDDKQAFDPAMSPPGTDAEAASPHDEAGLKEAREANRRPPGPKP
ncbi:MAG: hypothetical protein JOY71_23795 [Acetobacteraceae bacterium]|nr:hypothetical protein [Acetobacteraceae bacterium]MBV8525107.1 hypothetical protein [Acetobacteraceae bacterium]MBV8591089.1 hypothetical protein [Acetobacteraceae bacterium]